MKFIYSNTYIPFPRIFLIKQIKTRSSCAKNMYTRDKLPILTTRKEDTVVGKQHVYKIT